MSCHHADIAVPPPRCKGKDSCVSTSRYQREIRRDSTNRQVPGRDYYHNTACVDSRQQSKPTCNVKQQQEKVADVTQHYKNGIKYQKQINPEINTSHRRSSSTISPRMKTVFVTLYGYIVILYKNVVIKIKTHFSLQKPLQVVV